MEDKTQLLYARSSCMQQQSSGTYTVFYPEREKLTFHFLTKTILNVYIY